MTVKNLTVMLGVGAILLMSAASLRADVTMSLIDPSAGGSGSQFCTDVGISAALNGSSVISSGDWIGIYSFNVQAGSSPNLSNPFYTVSLSPTGSMVNGNFTYSLMSFAQANPGPSATSWAWNGNAGSPQYWGLQDANFLFTTFSGSIIGGNGTTLDGLKGSESEQGAALALAMYSALYNSTGYGRLGGNAFKNNSTDTSVDYDYNILLSALKSFGNSPALATGSVLGPDNSTGPDTILLGSDLPQGGPLPCAVPEPTTIFAGALLLLPFGASTIRALRRRTETV